jgi:hypothetical protein
MPPGGLHAGDRENTVRGRPSYQSASSAEDQRKRLAPGARMTSDFAGQIEQLRMVPFCGFRMTKRPSLAARRARRNRLPIAASGGRRHD